MRHLLGRQARRLEQALNASVLLCAVFVFGCLSSCVSKGVAGGSGDVEKIEKTDETVAHYRDSVKLAIGQRLVQLQECYHQAIDRRPGAEGKLVVSWEVSLQGKVENAAIASAHPKIEEAKDCVLAIVKNWEFPPPPWGEAIEIRYPFYFTENGRVPKTKTDANGHEL